MSKPKRKSGIYLICLTLAAITVLTFLPVKDHEFLNIDDDDYVTKNPVVQSGLTISGIRWAFTSNVSHHWHPLTWLSHMLDCELFGQNSAGHHLVNLLLHVINTILLFLILASVTKTTWQSAFVAALFAIHPFHVESVAWVSERKDTVSTLFWLLTMAFYFKNDLANAIIYWKRALKINPRYTDANFNIAAAYMELNQPDKAIPHLKAELALNPSNRRAIEALNAVTQTPRRPQK